MVSPYRVLARPGGGAPLLENPTVVVADGNVTADLEVPQAGNYAIERSANLSSWPVVGNVSASSPGIIVFEDPAPLPDGEFYRVELP